MARVSRPRNGAGDPVRLEASADATTRGGSGLGGGGGGGAAIGRRGVCLGLAAGLMAAPAVRAAPLGGAYLDVNGDRQWLMVAGSGPPLLILHGGPGASETVLFRHFNRALEHRFTVAYWDQRGAGRSYDPERPPPNMTVAQLVRDLDVVVGLLRERLGAPVLLLGHSWGSALGLLYARERPDAVAGFIGVGQVADQGAQERASWAWALSEARRRGHGRAVRALEGIGAPPLDVPALMVKNRWVGAFDGDFAPGFSKTRTLLSALIGGETGVGEVRRLIAANTFSLRALWPEVRTLDLPARVPGVDVPVAFLLGRLDRQCPSDLAAAYLGRLGAPSRRLVWFERSAHNPPFEEPEAFDAAVLGTVHVWG